MMMILDELFTMTLINFQTNFSQFFRVVKRFHQGHTYEFEIKLKKKHEFFVFCRNRISAEFYNRDEHRKCVEQLCYDAPVAVTVNIYMSFTKRSIVETLEIEKPIHLMLIPF